MPDYTVTNSGTPFYRWRQSTLKAREGNLGAGFPVSGNINGELLIISHTMPGAEEPPPYAMYLAGLTPVDGGTTPPPTNGDEVVYPAGELQLHIQDGELAGTWQNVEQARFTRADG